MIKRGIKGKNTHLPPTKALEDLTPQIARMKPQNNYHSCWELLHHTVVWQEAIFEAIIGKKVDWEKISRENNWPGKEYLTDNSNFIKLIEKFNEGLKKAQGYDIKLMVDNYLKVYHESLIDRF